MYFNSYIKCLSTSPHELLSFLHPESPERRKVSKAVLTQQTHWWTSVEYLCHLVASWRTVLKTRKATWYYSAMGVWMSAHLIPNWVRQELMLQTGYRLIPDLGNLESRKITDYLWNYKAWVTPKEKHYFDFILNFPWEANIPLILNSQKCFQCTIALCFGGRERQQERRRGKEKKWKKGDITAIFGAQNHNSIKNMHISQRFSNI